MNRNWVSLDGVHTWSWRVNNSLVHPARDDYYIPVVLHESMLPCAYHPAHRDRSQKRFLKSSGYAEQGAPCLGMTRSIPTESRCTSERQQTRPISRMMIVVRDPLSHPLVTLRRGGFEGMSDECWTCHLGCVDVACRILVRPELAATSPVDLSVCWFGSGSVPPPPTIVDACLR